jgi:hypothetical protein
MTLCFKLTSKDDFLQPTDPIFAEPVAKSNEELTDQVEGFKNGTGIPVSATPGQIPAAIGRHRCNASSGSPERPMM